ncbi:MAG: glutamate-5-semialdehyde dehydrogenase [Cyanobacteria bacterium P01_H01_bin.15]
MIADTPTPDLVTETVQQAYQAALRLEMVPSRDRNAGVLALAEGLEQAFDEILEANTLDLEASREMAVPELIQDWLKLTPGRLERAVKFLEVLAQVADPIQTVQSAPYQLNSAPTYCQLMPLGTIALIYEAFPELGIMAAGLCLKTGNSLVLRGSPEGSHSNDAIAAVIRQALTDTELPSGAVSILPSDRSASIQKLVAQAQYLNLIIPYGRPNLTQQVMELATAPVLKTAIGNCYLYWSESGKVDLVREMIFESWDGEPDAVNALEKVLISNLVKSSFLSRLFGNLRERGWTLRGEADLVADFPDYLEPIQNADEWSQPYLSKTIAFKMADGLQAAISWINQHSSGHADGIVTESYQESRLFAREIDSALVYINASPRFSRYIEGSENVFLGISSQKGYRRGPIGMATLTTLKQVIQSDREC